MTKEESFKHWQQRAWSELDIARSLLNQQRDDFCAGALFHCSLSLELALKARYIEKFGKSAPFTHDLVELATLLKEHWNEEQLTALEHLSEYAVLTRYADNRWLEEQATPLNAQKWINEVETFLNNL